MLEYNPTENQFKIVLPISGIEELSRYRKGIIGVLNKVEINDSDPSLREDLKSVYRLLNQLLPDKVYSTPQESDTKC